MSEKRFSC